MLLYCFLYLLLLPLLVVATSTSCCLCCCRLFLSGSIVIDILALAISKFDRLNRKESHICQSHSVFLSRCVSLPRFQALPLFPSLFPSPSLLVKGCTLLESPQTSRCFPFDCQRLGQPARHPSLLESHLSPVYAYVCVCVSLITLPGESQKLVSCLCITVLEQQQQQPQSNFFFSLFLNRLTDFFSCACPALGAGGSGLVEGRSHSWNWFAF